MTARNKKIKRLFISDIHMGDTRSTISGDPPPPHAYGWFRDIDEPNQHRPDMLADLLKNYIIPDDTIDEVILLGDIFDDWNVPADLSPCQTPGVNRFEAIASSPHNEPVIANLKTLAAAGKLTYITGNHDMLITKEENRRVIKEIFPGINLIGDQGAGAYKTDDGILAEHGHCYTLFNTPWQERVAPAAHDVTKRYSSQEKSSHENKISTNSSIENSGSAGSMIPFGFYVSRCEIQFRAQKGREYSFFDLLRDTVTGKGMLPPSPEKFLCPLDEKQAKAIADEIDKIIIGVFKVFRSNDVFDDQEGVRMDGFDGIPGVMKWKDIDERFARIYRDWEIMHPDSCSAYRALINNLFKLKCADDYVLKKEQPKILIFGHSHVDKLDTRDYGNGPQIYANTGAWINKRDCTFVKTEFDPGTGEHKVDLWQYWDEKISLLESAAVKVQGI